MPTLQHGENTAARTSTLRQQVCQQLNMTTAFPTHQHTARVLSTLPRWRQYFSMATVLQHTDTVTTVLQHFQHGGITFQHFNTATVLQHIKMPTVCQRQHFSSMTAVLQHRPVCQRQHFNTATVLQHRPSCTSSTVVQRYTIQPYITLHTSDRSRSRSRRSRRLGMYLPEKSRPIHALPTWRHFSRSTTSQ